MPATKIFYYSALDFGVSDYSAAQSSDRTADDSKVLVGTWMVPLYAEKDRTTSVVGYVSWQSVATTTDDGQMAVSELITITTNNKGMLVQNSYTNSNGYYQEGELQQALIIPGSMSHAANTPFSVTNKKYVTFERSIIKKNWRELILTNSLPNSA